MDSFLEHTRLVTEKAPLIELVESCELGRKFYYHLASQIDSQTLRNQFFIMAKTREQIIHSLKNKNYPNEQQPYNHPLPAVQSPSTLLNSAYRDLKKSPLIESLSFLNELEKTEGHFLYSMRQYIKAVGNRQCASLMASNIASLQIVHDQLKALIFTLEK